MSEAVSLDQFIALGQSLNVVANPQPWHVDVVANEIATLLQQLQVCGMVQGHVAAQPLGGITINYRMNSGLIDAHSLRSIEGTMRSVIEVLYGEARQKRVVVIQPNEVSQKLRDVTKLVALTSIQEQLQHETILCLERGAYRAAVVMGWCFAYDIIRYWIFYDATRLAAFNVELAKYTKSNGTRVYDDIINYDDFFTTRAPGESKIIEIATASGLIGGREARKLVHCLDTRNNYAHASSTHPTANQANALVENMLDIALNPPFVQPPPPVVSTPAT